MSLRRATLVLFTIAFCTLSATAQTGFPTPSFILHDAKHKEPKSGVQINGNSITIQPGVGTPTAINALTFSQDGSLLAAGKDFGRVVVWETNTHAVLQAFDTGQRIVGAVAISPDKQTLATAGSEENPSIQLWDLSTGKPGQKFAVEHPPVQRLEYLQADTLLVTDNGGAYVLNTKSGDRPVDLTGERLPALSNDRSTLITVKEGKYVFRNTADWSITSTIAQPVKNAWPLALDAKRNLLVYGAFFVKPGFMAARISGTDLSSVKAQPLLPQFNPSAGYLAAVDPSSGTVFLHSNARAWAWNVQTAKVCSSPILYSERGQLSPDGHLFAASIDNGILSKDHVEPGVEVWEVEKLLTACDLR
jgi:WD40 repeat protein